MGPDHSFLSALILAHIYAEYYQRRAYFNVWMAICVSLLFLVISVFISPNIDFNDPSIFMIIFIVALINWLTMLWYFEYKISNFIKIRKKFILIIKDMENKNCREDYDIISKFMNIFNSLVPELYFLPVVRDLSHNVIVKRLAVDINLIYVPWYKKITAHIFPWGVTL